MKTYEIKFNDYGLVYTIATDFARAEKQFLESGYGGSDVVIKSIVHMPENNPPLMP